MTFLRFFLLCTSLLCLVVAIPAQSLYTVDGPGGAFDEITGPPDPALCNYPNGPVIGSFPFLVGGPCPAPAPFPPPPGALLGDIAIDTLTDTVYVTDGFVIGVYSAVNGVMTNSMPAPFMGPLTGLGFDATGGILWMTDGFLILPAIPSPPGSCQPPAPLGLPYPPGPGVGFMTDIDWDQATGLTYVCDANGMISGMLPGGGIVIPPYPAGAFCPLNLPLTGIAIDSASMGTPSPHLYVTDGFTIAYEPIFKLGPPTPTFYTPFLCYPVPGPPTQGLDFAARPIAYGNATDPSGLLPPTIGSAGQSVLPNPAFGISLNGAVPNSSAYLVVGVNPSCPALNFKGTNWYVNPFLTIIGPLFVPASGNLFVPAPLGPPGPAFPPSLSGFLQWMVQKPTGNWQATEGLELTLALP
ncbi:MAG: hypothetical protein ACYTG2_00450 [Planctomycetota bacterium]|jgi:hypothetical protein